MVRWIHNDTECRQECCADEGFEVEVVDAARCRKLERELAEARRDSERLDKIERMGFTRITDSERYLPKQIFFGRGTNRTIRQAIDIIKEDGR